MAVFPLPTVPAQDYHRGGLRFGASRSGGDRRHAGCDLIAKKGTPIRAVEWGLVLQGPKYFFQGTYSIVVQHSGYIVRYCEVDKEVAENTYAGAYVDEGQTIAYVGKMYKSSMLHLEMYQGTASGRYTQKRNKTYDFVDAKPFKRRRDLIDPTPYLDKWRLESTLSDWIGDFFD